MALMGKNLPINAVEVRDAVRSLSREDPWSRKWQSAPVFLPGESQGQMSLAGYSPCGSTESDKSEQLSTAQYIHIIKHCMCTLNTSQP